MSYEIDREAAIEPSLTEMALKALDDLYAATKKTEKGFFILIEASRIVSLKILPIVYGLDTNDYTSPGPCRPRK